MFLRGPGPRPPVRPSRHAPIQGTPNVTRTAASLAVTFSSVLADSPFYLTQTADVRNCRFLPLPSSRARSEGRAAFRVGAFSRTEFRRIRSRSFHDDLSSGKKRPHSGQPPTERRATASQHQPMNARDILQVPERSTMKRTKSSLLAFKLREVSNSAGARTDTSACIPEQHMPMHCLCQAIAAARALPLPTRLIMHLTSLRHAVSRREGQCRVL